MLIAWKERRHQHSKDAQDLVFLLTEYINADNIERVSEEHQDLLLDHYNTVGVDAEMIRKYVKYQESNERQLEIDFK